MYVYIYIYMQISLNMAHSRTIFLTNIFLNLGNLFLALNYISLQKKIEHSLICQSLLLLLV